MKLDMHGHTYYSKDSRLRPRTIVERARAMGLDALCITDHNEIDGAFEVSALREMPIVVGEEVRTSEGEIIGLYLHQRIEPDFSPEETIAAIREQGGLVYVPHPFDTYRGSRLRPEALERIVGQVDILEVFNARNLRRWQNDAALAFATRHRLLMGAGSDSHTAYEIGHAYVDMPAFDGPEQLLSSLAQGVPKGRLTNPLVHILTRLDRSLKAVDPSPARPV